MKANAQQIDGRVLRRSTTRQKIIDAFIDLINEGRLTPSAQDVASRAEIGLRSVFRHFSEMETLFVQINARVNEKYQYALHKFEAAPNAALETRIAALVKQRIHLYTETKNIFLTTFAQEWRYPILKKQYRELLHELESNMLRALPELADGDEAKKHIAFGVLSFEFWDLQTRQRGLSAPKTRALITQTLTFCLQK